MKRAFLLALSLMMLLSALPVGIWAERLASGTAFATEDQLRENVISDSLERTEGGFSRFFSESHVRGEGKYIVRFAETLSEERLLECLEGREYRLLSHSSQRVFVMALEDGEAFAREMGDALLYCCEDRVLTASAVESTGDPMAQDLPEYGQMELYDAWPLAGRLAGITVAVLDTGVARSHEDLVGANILDGYDAVTHQAGVFDDEDGHGTAVTGLIAAVSNGVGTVGVAPGVTVLPIRVAGDAHRIYSSDLIDGIRFAADAGADILNLSLGGYTYSVAEYDAVQYALKKGCILIAAAGNDGDTAAGKEEMYPASYEGVISVGSCDGDGLKSAFSQNNSAVDLLAPGEDLLLLTVEDGESSYDTDDGTSFSAALVSGLAALALSALEPSYGVRLEGAELLALLADGRVRKDGSGYGSVNAMSALQGVNLPIVTGVEHNRTYDRPVTVRFNRGTAMLDGEPCTDGTTVYANGIHRLTVTEGDTVTGVLFRINRIPASYRLIRDDSGVRFEFSGGTAAVDGIPYTAETVIAAPGWHSFVLTDGFGDALTEQFFVDTELPLVQGVEDGGVYHHPVYITMAGTGEMLLDGQPVGRELMLREDGTHQLVLQNGSASRALTFTLETGVVTYENELSRSGVIPCREHGWLAVYSEMLTGIRVYDLHTGEQIRVLNTETVNGYVFAEGRLLIFGEWKLTVLDPALMREGNPVLLEKTIRCQGFAYGGDTLYCLSDGMLLSLDPDSGEMVPLLETDADELYTLGTDVWLYHREGNRFDRLTEDGTVSYTPAFSAGSKRKLFAGNMLFWGDYCVRLSDFSVAYRVEGYALRTAYDLLYTTEGVYDLLSGRRVGTFGEPVSDVKEDGEGVFVCGFYGGISYYPRRDAVVGYAPTEGTLVGDPRETGAYSSLYSLYGDASPDMLASYGNRTAAVFSSGRKFLLWMDGRKVEETALPFAPTGVALYRERVCIWDGQSGLFWLDGVQYHGGMPIQKAFFALGRLYVLSEEMLYVMENGALRATGLQALDAGGGQNLLLWIDGDSLFAYDGETERSVPCGAESLLTDGTYVFAGKRLYLARTLQSFKRMDLRAFAMYDGMMLTDQGLVYAGNGTVLSSFEGESFKAALGGTAGATFAHGAFLTVSGFEHPVWELPLVDGIPADGLVDQRTAITFDRGLAFLDGEAYTADTPVTQPGAHLFTLVLPCGMVRSYEFFVVPALNGIRLTGPKRVAVGETGVLHVQYAPEGTSAVPVVYSVKGTCIRLAEDGSFLAVGEGMVTVYATTADGRFRDSIRIWVESALLRFDEAAGLTVKREDGILLGVPSGTHRNDVLSQILSDGDCTASKRILGTGTVITLSVEDTVLDTLTVAVEGDLDGDGYVTLQDLLWLEACLEKGEALTVAQRYAADLSGNGYVTDMDVNLLKELLLYKNDAPKRDLPSGGDTCEVGIFLPSAVVAGDVLAVTLYLQDNEFASVGTTGAGGRLRYDENVLEYDSADFYGWSVELFDQGTWLSFLAWGEPATGEMPFLTVYFRVKEPSEDIRLRLRDTVLLVGEEAYGLASKELHFASAERVYGDLNMTIEGMTALFDPEQDHYEVYLPAGTPALDYALTYPEGCSVTVENTVFHADDRLEAVFTFRLPGGETKIYTVTALRGQNPADRATDTKLQSLAAAEAEIPFHPDVFEYTLTVPYHVDRLSLSWVTADENAIVSCSDTHLTAGIESVITLTVKGNKGEQTVYTLKVYREHAPEKDDVSKPSDSAGGKPWWIPVVILLVGGGAILVMLLLGKKKQAKDTK